MIGKTVSHYRITRELGAGGMGVVYEAVDIKLDRTVALKFLPPESTRDPDAKARFVHEAKAASALDHPNVCTIYEVSETEDGQLFLALACYEGKTLKERIARGPLPINEALDITRQVAEGLTEAHGRDIVHRDIKPANLFITENGLVKILDFGLAKLAGLTKLTQEGSTLGTAHYMSPEQAGGQEVDHRSDLWCLGVVLYEMVTGRVPFQGDHAQAVTYAILNSDPEPVTGLRTGVPLELERIIGKCLAKNSADRYQHAEDLLTDLKVLQRHTDEKSASTITTILSPWRGPKRWLWVAAALASVVALLLIAYTDLFESDRMSLGDERIMLAVLPFENLGNPDDAYFADGITIEILTKLSAVADLGVIARESSFRFRGEDHTIPEIGDRLGVDYVLKGTIRWQHSPGGTSNIRVTPRLVSVAENRDVWASAYEEELDQVFAVQANIGMAVVEALNKQLGATGRFAINDKPTDDMVAYEQYLRAKDIYTRSPMASNLEAIESLLHQAITRDPEFAQAHALAAINHSEFYHYRIDRSGARIELARKELSRALAIDPDLPEGHFAFGIYSYIAHRDYSEALRSFEIVLRHRPSDWDALHWTGVIRKRQGRLEEALDWYHRALLINPMSRAAMVEEAIVLTFLDRRPEAVEKFEHIIALWPDEAPTYVNLSELYRNIDGNTERGRPLIETALDKFDSSLVVREWITLLIWEGRFDEALWFLEELTDFHDDFLDKHLIRAEIYCYLGRDDLMAACADSARLILEPRVAKDPKDPVWHRDLGIANAYLGNRSDALREAQLAISLMPIDLDAITGPEYVFNLAQVYVLLGDFNEAIDQLETLLATDFLTVPALRTDPIWKPLHDNLRFQELVSGSHE